MDTALVHDSFTQMGGAERVIEELHKIYPSSPIYTLVLDRKFKDKYKSWDIRTSWLQVLYNFIPQLKFFLPLIPLVVSSFNLERYDVVISSSSGFVKNIKLSKNVVHINYCHTPTRFLWCDNNYTKQEVPNFLRGAVTLFLKWMKKWDYRGAQRVTYFIANSKEVQKRIRNHYNRGSEVIYPGVNLDFWKPTREKQDYFLLAGRLQAHKKNALIVEIFSELDLQLHIVGTGRQEKYLKSISGPNIKFLGAVDDEKLRDEYSSALALIYPQVEDFGLIPIEAAACGTATIAYAKGGSLETIIQGQTGELFDSYDKNEIKQIFKNWDIAKYNLIQLRLHAEKFDRNIFREKLLNKIKYYV